MEAKTLFITDKLENELTEIAVEEIENGKEEGVGMMEGWMNGGYQVSKLPPPLTLIPRLL